MIAKDKAKIPCSIPLVILLLTIICFICCSLGCAFHSEGTDSVDTGNNPGSLTGEEPSEITGYPEITSDSDDPAGSAMNQYPAEINDSLETTAVSEDPDLNTESQIPDDSADAQSDSQIDWFIPAYAEPTLEELYDLEPFSELIPREFPEGFSLSQSYMTLDDERIREMVNKSPYMTPLPDPSPENRFVIISLKSEDSGLSIAINKHQNKLSAADPDKPETYLLSAEYEARESDVPRINRPEICGTFYASDLTEEIISARTYYSKKTRLLYMEICILCDEFSVDYRFASKDITLSSKFFYDMITSSRFFTKTEENSK